MIANSALMSQGCGHLWVNPENVTRCMCTNGVNELGTGTALGRERDVFY